jgi:hypothetical protein
MMKGEVGKLCHAKSLAKLHSFIHALQHFFQMFLAIGKAELGLRNESNVLHKFSKQLWAIAQQICRQEIVNAYQHFGDQELIHRSQAGDIDGFGELVTKYRTKIFNVIYGIVGNENDAWDLAQEGFLKAWRSIHRFQGRSSFYMWLYRITMNVTLDSLRRRCRRSEVELDDAIPSFLPGPGVNCERAEIQRP